MSEKRVYDVLGSFPLGINSGVDPLLLPRNQLAFARNATNRGDFVKQRPSYKNLALEYDSDNTRGNFQMVTALFQGATYYLKDTAAIMVAVGGKLFKIEPATDTALVTQIVLPDAGNSTTEVRNWLWQSERWLIWNDGINLPMFWDGTTARRSNGDSNTALASVSGTESIIIPAIGQIKTGIPVSAAYGGPLNTPVIIGANGSYGQYLVMATAETGTIYMEDVTATLLSPSVGTYETKAIFYKSNLYQGRPTNITQGTFNPVNNWSQIYPISGGAQQITINGPFPAGLEKFYPIDQSNECQATPLNCKIALGDKITIGGKLCTVVSITSSPDSLNNVVSSFKVTPDAQYSGAVSGAIVLLSSHWVQWAIGPNLTGTIYVVVCNNQLYYAFRNNSPTGTIGGTIVGSPTWDTNYNTFTVTLSKPWTGPASGRIKVFGKECVLVSALGSVLTCYIEAATSGAISYPAVPASLDGVVKILNVGETFAVIGISSETEKDITGSQTYVINKTSETSISDANVGDVFEFQDNAELTSYVYVTASENSDPATVVGHTIDVKNLSGTPDGYINPGDEVYLISEIPISTIGVYGMGRNWVCKPDKKSFVGCDLVGSSAGSLTYDFTDAVLSVSQNQQLAGGGTFVVPGAGLEIKAMRFTAALDASMGQGALQVLTNQNIFSCNATTNILEWATMTSPILTESLIGAGGVSQTSVSQANADLLFRSSDGDIRSMLMARLDFNRWGNTPISREVTRSIVNDDRTLLGFCSSIVSNNRLLMVCQPVQTLRGVAHAALASLNFDSISSLQGKQASAWESEWTIPNALQLVNGFFDGVERAFAICLNDSLNGIELREVLQDTAATKDDAGTSVGWFFESPVLFNEPNHQYKRLIDGELFFKDISETIAGQVFYKPDQNSEWQAWYDFNIPLKTNDSTYRPRVGLGMPPANVFDSSNDKPMREGYCFQLKVVLTGACTFVGGRFAADIIPQPEFARPGKT